MTIPFDHDSVSCLTTVNEFLTACAGVPSRCPFCKRVAAGMCEGRKSWAEINPELVREAQRPQRRSPEGHQRSLRGVAAELAKLDFVNQRGAEASSIASIVEAHH